MSEPLVSVVVPVRDGAGLIGRQLEALAGQVGAPSFEVVVADNGSSDGLAGVVGGFAGRLDVRVVDASARRGASFARNVGALGHARGAKVLFCDADDCVTDGWVRSLAGGLDRFGIVTGPLVHVARLPDRVDVAGFRGLAAPRLSVVGLPYGDSANLGLRREVFESLDGFDTELLRGEDQDLSIRAQVAGHGLGWVDDAVVFVADRGTVGQGMRQFFLYGLWEVAVSRKYARSNRVERSVWSMVRPYVGLVGRSWQVLSGRTRRAWLVRASHRAGRLAGSAKFRHWCP